MHFSDVSCQDHIEMNIEGTGSDIKVISNAVSYRLFGTYK